MQRIIQSFLLLLVCLILGCKASNLRKDTATKYIDDLEAGALMVRLKTSEKKIAKLKEIGDMEAVEKAINEQQTVNKNIVNAFNNHFDFCPVYFFHSNDVKNVMNNDFQGSVFQKMGEDLVSAPTAETYFLMGELDFAYQDELIATVDGKPRKAAGLGGVTAIVIRDKNNIQIPKPFPYRATMTFVSESSLNRAVNSLNTKLKAFDNKMERRKLKRRLKNSG